MFEGACTDSGARTPIGVSKNTFYEPCQGGCGYYDPNCRLFIVEYLVNNLKFEVNCLMARFGCPVTMVQGQELDDHEKECALKGVQGL